MLPALAGWPVTSMPWRMQCVGACDCWTRPTALYLELTEIEQARGRPERVPLVWDELRRRRAEDADDRGGLVTMPLPEIETALQKLLSGAR